MLIHFKGIDVFIIIVSFFIISYSNFCFADEKPTNAIEIAHDYLDSEILYLSRSIDSILGGRKAFEEGNKSYIELSQEYYGGEIEKFSQFSFRARLRVPQTKNLLHLFLERQKETLFEPTAKETNFGQNEPQRRYRAGLQINHFKSNHFFGALKSGVRIKALKLQDSDGFIEYRLRYLKNFSKHTKFETHVIPSYYLQAHLEYESSSSLEYSPLKNLLLRFANGASWRKADKIFNLSQGLSINYQMANRKITSLNMSLNSNDQKGMHAETYQIGGFYGQSIHWDWLTCGVNATLLFDKANHFKGQMGYGGNLAIKIGN